MLQIFIIIFLLAMCGFIFLKYPLKINARTIAMVAFLIVIYQVVSYFSITLTFLGYPALKIGFGQLVLIIAGSILAPGWAIITAFLSDLLGVVLRPSGGYYFGFTLNAILTCLIPSLLFYHRSKLNTKILRKILFTMLIILPFAATLYVFSLDTVTSGEEVITVTNTMKYGVMMSTTIISLSIVIIMKIMTQNTKKEQLRIFIMFALIILGIDLLIQFFLTPLWLLDMYNTPFFASQFVRILKAIIITPLYLIIGFSVYNIIIKILKKDRIE